MVFAFADSEAIGLMRAAAVSVVTVSTPNSLPAITRIGRPVLSC